MRPWMAAVVRLLLGWALALIKFQTALRRRAQGLFLGLPVPRGRPPRPPRVLGVVVVGKQKSLSEEELRATSRVIAWAVGNHLTLLTLYSPHELLAVSSVVKALGWIGAEDDVTVWSGWHAPREWTEGSHRHQAHRPPTGVALLGPAEAEGPLAMMKDVPVSASTSGEVSSSPNSLQRALRAPEELRRVIGSVGGPVAQLDPDIIMIFGGVSSLFGYPSWMTRSSEIYSMGDLASVEVEELSASLHRYMRTKKRGGR